MPTAKAKTAIKRGSIGLQNDLNVKQTTMGHWTTKEMRKGSAGGGKPRGRGSVKRIRPPVGGWTG